MKRKSNVSSLRDLEVNIMGGRMKGQAFVTFPNVESAKRALSEVHGYLLHYKPMIIEFGKSTEKKSAK